ncbi:MAG: hypothetical protein LBT03_00495 [Holosporales bacterium]|jgi:CNT family concentrative nucleoside transporter|nr:hypothetical protein [Holosporales bacterium]
MVASIFGYVVFLALAFVLRDRKITVRNWKPVGYGILFQLLIAFALTGLPFVVGGLEVVANGVMKLKDVTLEGTKFVFGYVGGGDLPFNLKEGSIPFVFAFQALPTVIVVSALAAILTHIRVLPVLAKYIGSVFKSVFNVNESVGIVSAAKIFLGQLEAPLLIRHKLESLPRADVLVILSLAYATISASLMPIYAGVLTDVCPDAMRHIITSSVISVISVLIVCQIMIPSDAKADLNVGEDKSEQSPYPSFIGAMSKGLSDGAFVWWCIVGSLIGVVSLIAIANCILELLPSIGGTPITLQRIFGIFMYPFAWLMGIQSQDISAVSQILGSRIAINETIAFFDLAKTQISADSVVKTIYAINNFGNFACIGITVGGLSAIAPGQKHITELAWKSFWAGLLATGLTSTLMSVFLSF